MSSLGSAKWFIYRISHDIFRYPDEMELSGQISNESRPSKTALKILVIDRKVDQVVPRRFTSLDPQQIGIS